MSFKNISTKGITIFNFSKARQQALTDMDISDSIKKKLTSPITRRLNQKLIREYESILINSN